MGSPISGVSDLRSSRSVGLVAKLYVPHVLVGLLALASFRLKIGFLWNFGAITECLQVSYARVQQVVKQSEEKIQKKNCPEHSELLSESVKYLGIGIMRESICIFVEF